MSTLHGAAGGQTLPLVNGMGPTNAPRPWADGAGFTSPGPTPGRLGKRLKAAIPRLLLAASVVLGAGSLLSTGSAHAANAYSCTPASDEGDVNNVSINFKAILAGDKITCGDKQWTINRFDFGGNLGNIEFEWINNPDPGYDDDMFSANINFKPSLVGKTSPVTTGFLDYNLKILDPNYKFIWTQLDSTVGVNPYSPYKTSVIKKISGGPTMTSLDGSQEEINPITLPHTINVVDTWTVQPRDVLTSIKDSYGQHAPGPLPLLGAGFAFGWSRKLRSRVRAAGLD